MGRKSRLPTKQELRAGAAKCAREIKLLDLNPSSIKRGLRRNRIQRDFAIFLTEFMKKHKINSAQALADGLFIGDYHDEVFDWLRSPVQYHPLKIGNQHKEFLLGLCESETDKSETE